MDEVVTCVNDVWICLNEQDSDKNFDDVAHGFMQFSFTVFMGLAAIFFAICHQMKWLESLNTARQRAVKYAERHGRRRSSIFRTYFGSESEDGSKPPSRVVSLDSVLPGRLKLKAIDVISEDKVVTPEPTPKSSVS